MAFSECLAVDPTFGVPITLVRSMPYATTDRDEDIDRWDFETLPETSAIIDLPPIEPFSELPYMISPTPFYGAYEEKRAFGVQAARIKYSR